MIGRLSGIYDGCQGSMALVDVNGVGYVVSCSPRTLRKMPPFGNAVRLYIETQMREDALHLYGFIDEAERSWFRILITVQGVGARVAQAILATLSPEQISAALLTQDKAAFTQADGVGGKLAARLVTELKDKAQHFSVVPNLSAEGLQQSSAAGGASALVADTLSALLNLGYKRAEAYDVVLRLSKSADNQRVDVLIAAALRELSAHGAAA